MCQVHTGSKTRPRCSVTFSLMTNIRSGSNNHYIPLSSNYSSLFSPVEVFTVWLWLLRRDLKNKQTGDTPWKWKSECCLFHWEKNEMRNNGYTARVCVCLPCSEKRVGNVYSKAKSFVDYVRRALRRLELDESKVWIKILQSPYRTSSRNTLWGTVQWKHTAP